jgi:hypothetical protein
MQFPTLSTLLSGYHAARVVVLGDVMLDRLGRGLGEHRSRHRSGQARSGNRTLVRAFKYSNIIQYVKFHLGILAGRAIRLRVTAIERKAQYWNSEHRLSEKAKPRIQ